ncbi:MAG: flippase [Candidatus Thermoplasmatota archaeon]|nr:flippase [Candidatus Thermoplasmatota archaeon]
MKADMTLGSRIKLAMKNFSYLVVGNVIAQIMAMIGLILITRYLGVRDYGIYSTVTSYISLFLFFTLPQINKVLIREGVKNEEKLDDILSNTVGLRVLVGSISIGLSLIGLLFVNYDPYTKILIAIYSITLLLSSLEGFYMIIYQVHERMQYHALIGVIHRLIYLVFTIIVVVFNLGLTILLIASILTLAISLILNIRISRRFARITFRMMLDTRWSLIKPVIIFSLLLFLGHLATSIDILMISNLRPYEDVGIYSIAVNLMGPGVILRNLLFIATFPMFIKTFQSQDTIQVKRLFQWGTLMGAVVILGAAVLSLASEPIIGIIFSDEYLKAAPIFSVLIFYLAFKYFELPFYNALQATGNELKLLYLYWIPPVVNIGLNYLFLQWFGLIGIAYSTMIVGLTTVVIMSGLTVFLLRKKNSVIDIKAI